MKTGANPAPITLMPESSHTQWSPSAVIVLTNGVNRATSAGSTSTAQMSAGG